MNDTIIGDPLFTVPLLVSDKQLQALNLSSLSMCYEVHGRSNQWFNLVTDKCSTVNAHYSASGHDLNLIDQIGVRAVDEMDHCLNIHVSVNQCSAEVNGVSFESRYLMYGVSIRRYSNRVRISVPNCNDLKLIMWVICQRRTMEDPSQEGMMKFVVMRGLNTGHRPAHGLLGKRGLVKMAQRGWALSSTEWRDQSFCDMITVILSFLEELLFQYFYIL